MDGLVSKPVIPERLAAAIRDVIEDCDAAVVSRNELPLFDQQVLHRLADEIGVDGMAEVVELFLAQSPRMSQRLEQAIGIGGSAVLREVHTLASSTRGVGLMRVGHQAAEMELMIATIEPSAQGLTALRDLLQESVARLAAWAAVIPRQSNAAIPLADAE
jgi:HPt (histidine-containing phosphotransfer) domain-containing protein